MFWWFGGKTTCQIEMLSVPGKRGMARGRYIYLANHGVTRSYSMRIDAHRDFFGERVADGEFGIIQLPGTQDHDDRPTEP